MSKSGLGIDLADRKLVAVVCEHDSRVLARLILRCRRGRSARRRIGPPTVQCERESPRGRWRVSRTATGRGTKTAGEILNKADHPPTSSTIHPGSKPHRSPAPPPSS